MEPEELPKHLQDRVDREVAEGAHSLGGPSWWLDDKPSLGTYAWGAASFVSTALCAYHGYKRNGTVGDAILWGCWEAPSRASRRPSRSHRASGGRGLTTSRRRRGRGVQRRRLRGFRRTCSTSFSPRRLPHGLVSKTSGRSARLPGMPTSPGSRASGRKTSTCSTTRTFFVPWSLETCSARLGATLNRDRLRTVGAEQPRPYGSREPAYDPAQRKILAGVARSAQEFGSKST